MSRASDLEFCPFPATESEALLLIPLEGVRAP
jgi:hypothetical protein